MGSCSYCPQPNDLSTHNVVSELGGPNIRQFILYLLVESFKGSLCVGGEVWICVVCHSTTNQDYDEWRCCQSAIDSHNVFRTSGVQRKLCHQKINLVTSTNRTVCSTKTSLQFSISKKRDHLFEKQLFDLLWGCVFLIVGREQW